MYYIISLKHTNRIDKYITLWKSDNCGYCYSKELAGLYDNVEDNYHNDKVDSIAIDEDILNNYFMKLPYDKSFKHLIINCKVIWDALNLKMTNNGLKIK